MLDQTLKEKPVNRTALTVILLFFFGLPIGGLLYFWNDTHTKIRYSAANFVQDEMPSLTTTWDEAKLLDVTTDNFRSQYKQGQTLVWQQKYGALKGAFSVDPVRSNANEQEDMMVQYVEFQGVVPFEKGKVSVHLRVARKTTAPRWRIDGIDLAGPTP